MARSIPLLGVLTVLAASAGCAMAVPRPAEMANVRVRDVTTLTAQELQVIRRGGRDVILLEEEPPRVQGRIIRMYGKDARGVYQIFLLNTCDGTLKNMHGVTVVQYPGEWGDTDCV